DMECLETCRACFGWGDITLVLPLIRLSIGYAHRHRCDGKNQRPTQYDLHICPHFRIVCSSLFTAFNATNKTTGSYTSHFVNANYYHLYLYYWCLAGLGCGVRFPKSPSHPPAPLPGCAAE